MSLLRWLLLFSLLLAACAPSFQDCAQERIVCAVILFHPWEAEPIGEQVWQALETAQRAGTLQGIWRISVQDGRDRERELRWMAEQGVDILITPSASWSEATQAVASIFSRQRFIAIDQTPLEQANLPNVTVIRIPYDQMGFLAGALSARLTQTRRVAAICEAEFIPAMRQACDGFVQGVLFTDRKVFVYRQHRQGSRDLFFQDEKWGRETADRFIRDGADVIFAIGGATARAALEQAAADQALILGGGEDLYDTLPTVQKRWVGAPLPEVQTTLETLFATTRHLPWPSVADGRLIWAPFRGYGESLPLSLRAEMELLRLQLQEGTIRTGVAP